LICATTNSDLLQQAKAYGINLSATLQKRLEALIREMKEKEWLEENQATVFASTERSDSA